MIYFSFRINLCFLLSILLSNLLVFAEEKKPTMTILAQIAADNNLFVFAGRNLKQMEAIGSNENVKIVINFDMRKKGNSKITKRLYIEKNKAKQIGQDLSLDSGDYQNLIDFCKWSIENYPSDEYALILWNHGCGILEPRMRHAFNPTQFFNFNPTTRMIEIDRSLEFFEQIHKDAKRGICFDDTSGNYLTNQKLKEALSHVCSTYLNGNKFAILACDACFMSMLEVAAPLKNYVEYFVGSQEVELGTGYNYTAVLKPFENGSMDKVNFAKHIVTCFETAYNKITYDYTQSALDLKNIHLLTQNVDELSKLLIEALQYQKNNTLRHAIRFSKDREKCTHFEEPSYIDLGHFYSNLIYNLKRCEFTNDRNYKQELNNLLQTGLELIDKIVIANVVGKNLKYAKGISIYFPKSGNNIHASYEHSEFALQTHWLKFMKQFFKN